MNEVTQKLKAKGYSLTEGIMRLGISLSSYRRYEKKSNPNHVMLNRLVDELKVRNDE